VAARWLMSEAAHGLDHDRRIADDTLAGPDQTLNRQRRGVGRLRRQPLVGPVLAQEDACRYRPTVNEAAMAMLDTPSVRDNMKKPRGRSSRPRSAVAGRRLVEVSHPHSCERHSDGIGSHRVRAPESRDER
jgi:hypothetical protein